MLNNVLSLFDGVSCGQLALAQAGIGYSNYYASEVDKYAMSVTAKKHPATKVIGDVNLVGAAELPKIDFRIRECNLTGKGR